MIRMHCFVYLHSYEPQQLLLHWVLHLLLYIRFPKGCRMHGAQLFAMDERWMLKMHKQEQKFLDIFIVEAFAPAKDPIFRRSCICSICPPSLFAVKDSSFFNWTSLVGIVCQWFGQKCLPHLPWSRCKWSMCGQMCKKNQWSSHVPLPLLRGKHVNSLVKYINAYTSLLIKKERKLEELKGQKTKK